MSQKPVVLGVLVMVVLLFIGASSHSLVSLGTAAFVAVFLASRSNHNI
jgi:hypothetical protein